MKCSLCFKIKTIYNKKNILCKACYNKQHPPKNRKCETCGKIKETHSIKNGVMCQKCYNKQYKNEEICSICNNLRFVFVRNNGNPICSSCRKKERYSVIDTLRKRLCNAFKRYSKKGKVKTSREYGINYQQIFEHLGNCPGDRKEYHIDHIFPLVAFNFNNLSHIKIAFSPENHRWLKKNENCRKGGKYNKQEFDKFMLYMKDKK